MTKCIVCDTQTKQINSFVFKCKKCFFLKSNLKPGHGREIEGISELRRENFKKIINVIKSIEKTKNLKILEIGSGNGFFLDECKKENIDITGSEADEEQYQKLKKNYENILKISLPLKELSNASNKYDYIIFNDVFEHLEDLSLVLEQLKTLLNQDGKILINLPSSDGIIFKFSAIINKFGFKNFYNRLWQKNLSSPHLSYFNNQNLKKLLFKHNYNLIYSGSLNSVSSKGNFTRLNSTIKSKLICLILTFVLLNFYYLQKIFPKDIVFHIYSINN